MSSKSLIYKYEQAIEASDISFDLAQEKVLFAMQDFVDSLKESKSIWYQWWKRVQKGIYLHGPVGIGKTYLMDILYDEIDYRSKVRFHFHHFMQEVDAQLRRLQGHKNPLKCIASSLANKARLIFFDEFLVHDVAVALILVQLLENLVAKGVILIITANTRPDDLYCGGVQHEKFLPAIELIKKHCNVIALENATDYRLGRKPSVDAYFYPLSSLNRQKMAEQFAAIAGENADVVTGGNIFVQNRSISFIKCSKKAVWFDFKIICNIPRSQLDYLELAARFDTIFISNVLTLDSSVSVATLLLIYLIDVLYDRSISLVINAASSLDEIYIDGEYRQEFKRTLSRLKEMQSADYLKRHPRRLISLL